MTENELVTILTTTRTTFHPKRGFETSFPNASFPNSLLQDLVEEITNGFDNKKCRELLDALTPRRLELATACFRYEQQNNRQAPLEYVCNLLKSKTTSSHDAQHSNPPLLNDEQRATFDTDKLRELFKPVFYNGDDFKRDTLTGAKQTRFDTFCQRLEMILTDTDNKPTDKEIGGIAFMIYCSTYTVADYQKPKRTGQKGKFASMIRTFFEIVGMSVPSDIRPNKYQPNKELIDLFGDILQYQ